MFYIFDTLLKPIITYGSDVWGIRKSGRELMDKFFLKFAKNVLLVKQSTSNLMVLGESGQLLPSVYCIYNTVTYLNRIHHLGDHTFVKQVYNELSKMHRCGFNNWYSRAWELVSKYNLELRV